MDGKEQFKKLDGLHKSYQLINDRFIILFKLCKDISTKKNQIIESLILRVYNGQSLWMLDVNSFVIDQLRMRSGVEGSLSTLCEMIHHAIVSQDYSIQINDQCLQLNLQFLLGKGIYVKGLLDLGEAVPVINDEDYKQINKLFIFDLYDSLVTTGVAQVEKMQPTLDPLQKETITEPLSMKSKPKADMVRPTMRKRKGLGAKLI